MKQLVLLASGSGTNVENIATYFLASRTVNIRCVLTNKPNAQVLERCKRLNLPALYFNRTAFSASDVVLQTLQALKPDLIVLAGFLWKMPPSIIGAFPQKIINIHPALLPNYGGKGMYGMHVHQAVKNSGDKQTGITIHYVNEQYDEGGIIFQKKVSISPHDSPGGIAQKVHELEYEYYPKIIENVLINGQ